MGNNYSRYAKNLTTYFGASIIPMALSLAINPFIAMNMSPEDYAVSGYYLSFSTLIGPIIIFYMVQYYIKEYFRRSDDERERLFAEIAKALVWFSGIVSIFCFAGLLIYLKLYNKTFSMPISPYLGLMVFSLPLTGLYSLQQAQYRLEKNAKSFFNLSLGNSLIGVAVLFVFVVLLKWGAFGKLLAPLLGNAIIFIWLFIRFRWIWSIRTSWKEYWFIIVFCFPLAISAMLGYFTHGFSTTYLESIGDTTEYGIYIVGNSIGNYLTVFATAINNTFQPDFYETTIKGQWGRYTKFCLLQTGLIGIVVILFVVCAPNIINILTAGRYDASTPYAQVIAVSTLTSGIYFLINNFSIATNHPTLYLYTSIIGSAFIVIAMPFAVEKWSYVGGAWMTVVSFIVYSIINLALLIGQRALKTRKRISSTNS